MPSCKRSGRLSQAPLGRRNVLSLPSTADTRAIFDSLVPITPPPTLPSSTAGRRQGTIVARFAPRQPQQQSSKGRDRHAERDRVLSDGLTAGLRKGHQYDCTGTGAADTALRTHRPHRLRNEFISLQHPAGDRTRPEPGLTRSRLGASRRSTLHRRTRPSGPEEQLIPKPVHDLREGEVGAYEEADEAEFIDSPRPKNSSAVARR
jgi:hypothetical protein